VGDTVKKDEPLVELETDKAAQELVSPADGVLEEILVAEGENAGAGSGATAKPAAAPAAKSAAPASGASAMNIDVPNVGESVSEVTIASWMKQPGDTVAKDEAIVELETDKAAQELVAPEAGVMGEHLVAEGEVAKVGQTIATLLAGASSGAPATALPAAASPSAAASGDVKIMPAAAKVIRDNGLDASLIKGTGTSRAVRSKSTA